MEVLIISNSFIVKEGISTLFKSIFEPNKIKVISKFNDIEEYELGKYSFIFVDVDKVNMKDLEYICGQKKKNKDMRVMALDMSSNEKIFIKCINQDIDGYITNLCNKDEFKFIVESVSIGKKFYDAHLIQIAIKNRYSTSVLSSLTYREKEVMSQVAKGYSNREISEYLCITEFTVKKHISSIFSKLNLRSRQEIIIYAREEGIENLS